MGEFNDFNINDCSEDETLNRALKMAIFQINVIYERNRESYDLISEEIADVEHAVHIIEMVKHLKK